MWEKSDHGRIVALLSGILRVWEELMSKKKCCFRFQSGILLCVGKTDGDFYILLSTERYPPARGEDPSKSVVRFPVTKVPVSLTAALHSKVLCSLPGRMSSGPPQPYFVEILRRGGSPTAVGDEYPSWR